MLRIVNELVKRNCFIAKR